MTRKVITNNVEIIADEMDIDKSGLYRLLNNTESDSYAKFRHMFKAAARAGAPVEHWLNDLSAIHARNSKPVPKQHPMECIAKVLDANAATVTEAIQAFKDGQLDQKESDRILLSLGTYEQALAELKVLVQVAPAISFERANGKAIVSEYKNGNGNKVR
jgi:hypothetical protein